MKPLAPRRRSARTFALVAAASFARPQVAPPPAPSAATVALATKAEFLKLESIAKELATKGRAAEVRELLDVVAKLGEEAGALAKVRDGCTAALAAALVKLKTPATGAAVAESSRQLHLLAGDLAKRLTAADPAAKLAFGKQILRLDDDQPAAHEALGHTNANGRWLTLEQKQVVTRRAEFTAALEKARRLDFAFEIGEGRSESLAAVDPAPQSTVRFHNLAITSTMEAQKVARILRSVLQACAFSQFVRGRPLALQTMVEKMPKRWVLIAERQKYLDWIEQSLAKHRIKPEEAEEAKRTGTLDERGLSIAVAISEIATRSLLLLDLGYELFGREQQVCLWGGHLNWVSLTCFGIGLPGSSYEADRDPSSDRRSSDRRDDPADLPMKRLAKAGIAGARRWFMYLAARGEDPAWTNSFVDRYGKLVGVDLLKSTFMAEYLQEAGRFDALLQGTTMAEKETRSRAEVIDAALPEGLNELEREFHEWLAPPVAGIAQRLGVVPKVELVVDKSEQAALSELDRVRRTAWDESKYEVFTPMQLDRGLSEGCAAHCAYLKLHPDQLARWPDAHEEYPEKEGFSTDGCWAGMHSVIAPGVASAEDAIRGWMATFYHRLPLLEPGLKRIGFHLADRVAVLDSGSLVQPDEYIGVVVWPAREMKGVPTRFAPELPSPVPGADQSQWGYPITLQTTLQVTAFKMKLMKGPKASGPEVPCWFSSPGQPTNADCAPAGAFCLIPKAPLQSGTVYTVVAEPDSGETITWSFTTN